MKIKKSSLVIGNFYYRSLDPMHWQLCAIKQQTGVQYASEDQGSDNRTAVMQLVSKFDVDVSASGYLDRKMEFRTLLRSTEVNLVVFFYYYKLYE